MLIIGHRGAAGLAEENTLEALEAGRNAGCDILEFDIRLTKDGVPVLAHDFTTFRTHRRATAISRLTLTELNALGGSKRFVTLDEAFERFLGRILLNVELKGRGSGKVAAELLKSHGRWNDVLFSSFRASELGEVRSVSRQANLALLQSQNPYLFIAHQRRLQLTAVGFHRLYVERLALEVAKQSGLFSYAYTVNRPRTALRLANLGLDGIVTDYPDKMIKMMAKYGSD